MIEWSIFSVFNSRHRNKVETKKLLQVHWRSGEIDAREEFKSCTIFGLHVSGRLLTDNHVGARVGRLHVSGMLSWLENIRFPTV